MVVRKGLFGEEMPELKPKETEGDAGAGDFHAEVTASPKSQGSRYGLARRGKGRVACWGWSSGRPPSLESGHYCHHLWQVLSRGLITSDMSF